MSGVYLNCICVGSLIPFSIPPDLAPDFTWIGTHNDQIWLPLDQKGSGLELCSTWCIKIIAQGTHADFGYAYPISNIQNSMARIFCRCIIISGLLSKFISRKTLGDTSLLRTLSCVVFCHLISKCPSDEGTPPMWGHFCWGVLWSEVLLYLYI